jgi:hypothetical protein
MPHKFAFMMGLAIAPAMLAQPPAPKNLHVLPKTMSSQEVTQVMREFSFSLGVRCEFCHSLTDFSSDEKEKKRTARGMLEMVVSINRDVAKIAPGAPIRVECVTCHRGLSKPRTLQAMLAEAIDQHGIPAAIDLYKKLRKDDLDSGEYDFSERSLNQLSESLLRLSKTKEAVAIMELNREVNSPLTGWGRNVIAMSHQANGDVDKAIADYRSILELTPNDARAKQQLEQLQKTK